MYLSSMHIQFYPFSTKTVLLLVPLPHGGNRTFPTYPGTCTELVEKRPLRIQRAKSSRSSFNNRSNYIETINSVMKGNIIPIYAKSIKAVLFGCPLCCLWSQTSFSWGFSSFSFLFPSLSRSIHPPTLTACRLQRLPYDCWPKST